MIGKSIHWQRMVHTSQLHTGIHSNTNVPGIQRHTNFPVQLPCEALLCSPIMCTQAMCCCTLVCAHVSPRVCMIHLPSPLSLLLFTVPLQEWLWVVGYFLRAKLQFAKRNGLSMDDTISSIHRVLGGHAQALRDSSWQGLPELTNKDGAECSDSCPTQAWSMATLLDVLLDLAQVK